MSEDHPKALAETTFGHLLDIFAYWFYLVALSNACPLQERLLASTHALTQM